MKKDKQRKETETFYWRKEQKRTKIRTIRSTRYVRKIIESHKNWRLGSHNNKKKEPDIIRQSYTNKEMGNFLR